jgi:hypothetical protein
MTNEGTYERRKRKGKERVVSPITETIGVMEKGERKGKSVVGRAVAQPSIH